MSERRRSSSRSEEYQRKLAEQLSSKTPLSPKQIEEGVDKFIRKSRESLGGTELKPPYRRPVWYEKFFKLIQQRSVVKVSLEFIKLNITSGKSEAYKLQNGLRFLGLLDLKNNPTPELEKLRMTGEAFEKNLTDVIRKAYSDLFNVVLVESADPENLVNYMIEKYGYSQPLAEEATALFVYFCDKAHIPVSIELAGFRPRTERREGRSELKGRRGSRTAEDFKYDESFATLKFDEFTFAVKKDLSAIQFARNQVNSLLDYLVKKLQEERI